MIMARMDDLGIQWAVESEKDMDAAVSHAAKIVSVHGDAENVLYDGTAWISDRPQFLPGEQSFVIVAPQYVDERMEAVIEVFDALASEYLAPQVAAMSLESEESTRSAGFFAALAKLKVVAYGDAGR